LYREPKKYEEYAYVLEYLPHGRLRAPRTIHSTQGVLQLVGGEYFTLLEASPIPDAEYNIRDKIFVGKGDRALVGHILGRITYEELTSPAKAELPAVIEIIGKRLMFQILELRERYPFVSYEDLRTRANLSDPVKLISRRVLKELSEDEKYYIFTRPV
jgi:putative nucleotide binding protein